MKGGQETEPYVIHGGDAPSLRVESAEGITAYPGFNGDTESKRARAWVRRRLDEMEREYAPDSDESAIADAVAETSSPDDEPAIPPGADEADAPSLTEPRGKKQPFWKPWGKGG